MRILPVTPSLARHFFLTALLFAFMPANLAGQSNIFVSDQSGTIYRAEVTDPSGTLSVFLPAETNAGSMAFDRENQRLYFVERNSPNPERILRVSVASASPNPEEVILNLENAQSLAFDSAQQLLFYIAGDSVTRTIFSLDVSNASAVPQTVYAGNSVQEPLEIALDRINQRVIWFETDVQEFRNRDYAGQETPGLGLSLPQAFISGLAFDAESQRMFWSDGNALSVNSAEFDGANQQTLIEDELVDQIDFDPSTSPVTVYGSDGELSRVVRVQAGSPPITVLSSNDGLSSTLDVVFAEAPPTPTPTPTAPINLTPSTQLTEPPAVEVTRRRAKLIFQPFEDVLLEEEAFAMFEEAFGEEFVAFARNTQPIFRYRVQVNAPRKRNNIRRQVKRNEITLRRLRPGNYSVRYRAIAFEKRPRRAQRRLRARGVPKFRANNKQVYSTNFSPSAGFTISK